MVTEKILEETFKVKTLSMKDIQMLQAINDGLRFFLGGFVLFLNLNQEPEKVIRRHEPILRVTIEKGLDLRRGLRRGDLEPPVAAEADSVCLFRHGFSSNFSDNPIRLRRDRHNLVKRRKLYAARVSEMCARRQFQVSSMRLLAGNGR